MKKTILSLIACGFAAASVSAQTVLPAGSTLPNKITSDTILAESATYTMTGYTYVMPGATLWIRPGVTVKATTGAEDTTLIVTRGAKIMAEGTATKPIVFTSINDNGFYDWTDTGEWGGIAVLGNAVLNSTADPVAGVKMQPVEGLTPAAGDENLIVYGGTNDADDSGVIRYVSIRHTGRSLAAGDEIQGLTLGGVGNMTELEYIEVFSSADDGIEIFGGNVDLKHIVLAFTTDDGLDLDQGYRGRVQYLLVLQNSVPGGEASDKGGEWDGTDTPQDGTPEMLVQVANATFIGRGANTAINIRATGAAKVWNSVFVNYAKMIDIDMNSGNTFQQDRMDDIAFENNVFWGSAGATQTPAGLAVTGASNIDPTAFFQGTNEIANPGLTFDLGTAENTDLEFDVTPVAGSLLTTKARATLPVDGFFKQENYIGAFAANNNWAAGWTKLSQDGYFTTEGTWVNDPMYGWVYLYNGSWSGNVYFNSLNTFGFVIASDANGYWLYLYR